SCSSRGTTSSPTPSCWTTGRSPSCSRRSTWPACAGVRTSRSSCSEHAMTQPGPEPGPQPGSEPGPPDPSPGHLAPLGPGALVGAGLLGLLLGWLWHPAAERLTGTAPVLAWSQALVLFFVAMVVGGVAFVTWRAVHVRREPLEAHQMVNRLVLARA